MSDHDAPVVAVRDLSKSFGSLQALDNVSIDLHAGKVHALLGENGAGKTTLVRVVAGMITPDRGILLLDDHPVLFRDRRHAIESGIGFVQQHLTQVEALTAADNFLLQGGQALRALDRAAAAAELTATSTELGFALDASQRVRDMSFSDRQRFELVMAVSHDCRVLILDEPTSLLGASDTEAFFDALGRIRNRGVAVVYVTHKLREVVALADEVTVLRAGSVAARKRGDEIVEPELAAAMIGREHTTSSPRRAAVRDRPVVTLSGVGTSPSETGPGLDNLDMAVREGEIVGVAGLSGSGQEALAEVLVGLRPVESGAVESRSGRAAYIPEHRHRDGLAEALSVTDNLVVHQHRDLLNRGILWPSVARNAAKATSQGYRLPEDCFDRLVTTLSGGNQQRVVLARELAGKPDLVVAHNPYRGLDIAAIDDVRGRLMDAARSGAAVVILSPELDDLFDIANRIDVMFQGTMIGSLDPDHVTAAEIGQLVGGVASRPS